MLNLLSYVKSDLWDYNLPSTPFTIMKKAKSIFGDKSGNKGIWNSIKFTKRTLPEELIKREKLRLMEVIKDEEILPIRARSPKWIWYAAASFALLMTVGSIFLLQENKFETSYGQISTIILPDGSDVTLNGNSSLSYSPVTWSLFDSRKVKLQGEAFFDIAKMEVGGEKINFQVVTSNLEIEVLGTKFNVMDRGTSEVVVLEEGKVQVMTPSDQIPLQMTPGDYVAFDKSLKQIHQMVVLPEEYTSWKDKYILLDNKTLGEVAQIISSVYGKKVIFQNMADKKIPLEGKVPSDEIRILVGALRLVTKLEITFDEDVITVHSSSEKITQ